MAWCYATNVYWTCRIDTVSIQFTRDRADFFIFIFSNISSKIFIIKSNLRLFCRLRDRGKHNSMTWRYDIRILFSIYNIYILCKADTYTIAYILLVYTWNIHNTYKTHDGHTYYYSTGWSGDDFKRNGKKFKNIFGIHFRNKLRIQLSTIHSL